MVSVIGKFQSVSLSVEGAIAHLTFTQPDKANAMTRHFWQEFPQVLELIENDTDIRVLILSGDGKHFSSGMDLSVFSDASALSNNTGRDRERLRRLIVELQALFTRLEKLRVPVIAAVHGACLGAALDLVSACDLRYATRDAYFCLQEINLAMMADLGVLQRLPKLIPYGVAAELAFTGDKLSVERAQQIGLVNELFDNKEALLSAAFILGQKIAAKSPLAISSTKEALLFARDNGVESALAHAAILQTAVLDLADLGLAAKAAAQKSTAEFDKLLNRTSL